MKDAAYMNDEELAQAKDIIYKGMEEAERRLTMMLLPIVDIAEAYAKDCEVELHKTGKLRHGTKRDYNDAKIKINRLMPKGYHGLEENVYLDYLDVVSDGVKPVVENLIQAVQHIFDENNVKNSFLASKLEAVGIILTIAVGAYQREYNSACSLFYDNMGGRHIPKAVKRVNEYVYHNFSFYDPQDAQASWCRLIEKLFTYPQELHNEVVDNQEVNRHIELLRNKLADHDYLTACCEQVIEMNPNCLDYAEQKRN